MKKYLFAFTFFSDCLRKFILLTNKVKFKSSQTLHLLGEKGIYRNPWENSRFYKKENYARINSLHSCSILHIVGTIYFFFIFHYKSLCERRVFYFKLRELNKNKGLSSLRVSHIYLVFDTTLPNVL